MRGAGYPQEVKALVRLEVFGKVADTAPEWEGSKVWSVWWRWGESFGSGGIVGSW